MTSSTYLVALGSNRPGRHGRPANEVGAALARLNPLRASPIIDSAPLGPSIRRYANAVALLESDATPPELLARLKAIEQAFGRRRGRHWGARVIDLDIVLWSSGRWRSPDLAIPHVAFRNRAFVLAPLASLVPGWRDPVTGWTMRQLAARLGRAARLTGRRPIPSPRPSVGL